MTVEKKEIPPLGLGTFGLTGAEGTEAVLAAISIGYRHIDTAQSYGTEENVGAAIAASGLDRSAFFVTTKIKEDNLGRLEESLDESLATLGLDYVDLTLIHWPAPSDDPPVRDYIGNLARAQDNGKTGLIGVSNFTRRHVDEAIAEVGEGRLANNQFEQHVFLQNRVLAEHCRDRGVTVTAYKPVAGANLDDTAELVRIAEKHGATTCQIALAWLLSRGSIAIPKSAQPDRQAGNLAARDVRLDESDLEALAGLDCGRRFIDPDWGPDWD